MLFFYFLVLSLLFFSRYFIGLHMFRFTFLLFSNQQYLCCKANFSYCVQFQQIRQMIADVDKDGSGAIDFDEFVYMMTAKIGERDSKDELMKAFLVIDQDKNVEFKNCEYLFRSICPLLFDVNIFLYFLGAGEDLCCRHSAYCQGFGRTFY